MLLLFIFVLLCIISVIVYAKTESNWNLLSMLSLFSSAFCIIVVAVMAVLLVSVHLPHEIYEKRIEMENKYEILSTAISSDDKNVVILVSEISDYNTTVMAGRNKLHDLWISVFQYPFWDDMPLIEWTDKE